MLFTVFFAFTAFSACTSLFKIFGPKITYQRIEIDHDEDGDGIKDLEDILEGAKQDCEAKPVYKDGYYQGGYPPDGEGVCTDVIWRSLKHAGYSLKELVDEDIKNHTELYPRVEGKPDPNIDFRRIKNLKVFFGRHALELTTEIIPGNQENLEEWQGGDIVIFDDPAEHIAIISDKRNADGVPYMIHNSSPYTRETDDLIRWDKDYSPIIGHYRFPKVEKPAVTETPPAGGEAPSSTPQATSSGNVNPTPVAGETNPATSPQPSSAANTTPPVSPIAEEQPLSGKVICIDPGHQSVVEQKQVPIAPGAKEKGQDFALGTRGVKSGVYEYELVMDVSLKLRDELKALGATVLLTRERHDVLLSNIDRAKMANEANADVFIRIHCDGLDDSSVKGLSVLYPGDKYIKDEDMLAKSYKLSEYVYKSAVASANAKGRGLVERSDLIGFNYSTVPSTLIELGFMTNPDEDRLLNTAEYQDKLVEGMAEGILDYCEYLESQ